MPEATNEEVVQENESITLRGHVKTIKECQIKSGPTIANLPEIQAGYRCPLCPSHQDEDFVWDELAETYVCLGCSHEINNGFDFPQQPTIDEYNCADTIERLLALLGVSYEEARRRYRELTDTGKLCDVSCHMLHVI